MHNSKHILIAGTGRAGTTFLVELFTELGFDTGFSYATVKSKKNGLANAGLEKSLMDEEVPMLVKDPNFYEYAEQFFRERKRALSFCIIPTREISQVISSRERVHDNNIKALGMLERMAFFIKAAWYFLNGRVKSFEGGLVGPSRRQLGKHLTQEYYNLIRVLSLNSVPIIHLPFPEFLRDPEELYKQLKPITVEISFEDFLTAYNKVIE